MSKKQIIHVPGSQLSKAEAILVNIAIQTERLKEEQERAQKEMEKVRRKYSVILDTWKGLIKGGEKDLIKLMKANKAAIFGDHDKVNLNNGILFYFKGEVLHLPRDVVARILEQGEAFEDGIMRTPTLNRPVVEAWPDEKLTVRGGEKKEEETFSYELRETDKK